jgi:signal transduction histidine kinase
LTGNSIQSYETINSSIIDSDNPIDTSNRIIDFIISKTDTSYIITVKDYGCGIPQDIQDKLFKVMVTTKGHNGSGLGLFMSYSTIKGNFKGDLTFKSKVGEGTEFTITLPRK